MGQQTRSRIARWKPSRRVEAFRKQRLSSPGLPAMSLEGRLLVLCARTSVSEFVRVEIADLACDAINWELVWSLSKDHGIARLVYRNLATICPAAVPSSIHEAYRRHNQATTLMNNVLAKELMVLLAALAAQGITAIPFKGVTVAQAAYGDLTVRECADNDLIIEEGALSQARKVLWSQGYRPSGSEMETGAESHESSHVFLKRNGMVAADLQWAIVRRHAGFRADRSAFWSRLKPVRLPTTSVMGLCPEDLLLLLCVHGTIHAWGQLKWVCDVAELVRRKPALDWSRLLFQASEWKCRRMVLLGLAMAHNLFDIVLPRTVSLEIEKDGDISVLVRRMPRQLLKYSGQGIDEDSLDALCVTIADSSWERWKLALVLCRTDADVCAQSLPWFRGQRKLQILSRCLRPFLTALPKNILWDRIGDRLVRWLRGC